jgi:hypothetical protein
MKPGTKVYLGDAVYAEYDGSAIVLITENSTHGMINIIYLDDNVLQALELFKARIIKSNQEENTNAQNS